MFGLCLNGSEGRYVQTSTNWNTAYKSYMVFKNKSSHV